MRTKLSSSCPAAPSTRAVLQHGSRISLLVMSLMLAFPDSSHAGGAAGATAQLGASSGIGGGAGAGYDGAGITTIKGADSVNGSAHGGLAGGGLGETGSAGSGGAGGGIGSTQTSPGDLTTAVTGGNGGVGGRGGGGGGGDGAVVGSGGTVDVAVTGGDGGGSFSGLGGGGGGGAGIVYTSANAPLTIESAVTGGVGGNANRGGGGGSGIWVSSHGAVNVTAGTVRGGSGSVGATLATGVANGAGGAGAVFSSTGGQLHVGGQVLGGMASGSGTGGAGVNIIAGGAMVTVDNGAVIAGGAGGNTSTVSFSVAGAGGAGSGGAAGGNPSVAQTGTGGTGIVAAGGHNTIVTSGAINGATGLAGQANAITFSGGNNVLELRQGYGFTGDVVAGGNADLLRLGGDTGSAGSFDVSQIGAALGGPITAYQGFNSFEKAGAGTWTLTGTTAAMTPWTLSGGTLSVSSDGALGDPAGALTLDGGTLQWGAAFDLDAGRVIALGAGGGTFDTQGFDTTIAQALSGSGGLTKAGSGTLTLTGDSSAVSGASTVVAGTLAVDGTLGGTLTVNRGATLAGIGTVGSTMLASGAVLAPGNSATPFGTLTVNGNVSFAPGSTYQVQTAPGAGTSTLVHVTGTANLAGSVVHLGPDGRYAASSSYTILTADHGLHGTFDSVSSNLAFLTPSLAYDVHNVTLQVQMKQVPSDPGTPASGGSDAPADTSPPSGPATPPSGVSDAPPESPADTPVSSGPATPPSGGSGNPPDTRPIRFADAAATGNQRAVANALQSLPANNDLYSRVLNLPNGAPPEAFNALSGDAHASTASTLQGVSDNVINLPMDHLRRNLDAGQMAGPATAQLGSGDASSLPASAAQPVWAQVFGNWRRQGGNGDAAEVRESDGGLFVGADRAVGNGWRLGGALGYTGSHSSVNDRASKTDIDSYSATAYGGKAFEAGPGKIKLTAGAAYTWSDIRSQRDVHAAGLDQTLKSTSGASTGQVFTELGYALPLSNRATIEPFAGAAFSDLRMRGFSESGGSAALDGEGNRNDVTTTTLGLHARTAFTAQEMQGHLHGTVGWRHAFGDVTPQTTMSFDGSQAFTVAGAPIAQNAAVLELGADVAVSKTTTVGIAYNGQFGAGNQQNAGSVNVSWRF